MPNQDNPIFHWQDSGPNLWVGLMVTLAVAALGYAAFRSSKGRIAGIALVSAWALYVPFVFIGSRICPEEVSISRDKIQGCHNFSRFRVDLCEARSIQGSRGGKGGYAIHVFLKSGNEAVGIPVIWDEHKTAYKDALRKVSPDADLDW